MMLMCTANVTVEIHAVHDQSIVFEPPLPSNRTIVVYIKEELPVGSVVLRPVVRDVDSRDAVIKYQLNSSATGYLAIDNDTGYFDFLVVNFLKN